MSHVKVLESMQEEVRVGDRGEKETATTLSVTREELHVYQCHKDHVTFVLFLT